MISIWRRFAQRHGLGCVRCGRWRFGREQYCRTHLGEEIDRIIRKVVFGKDPS